MAFTRHQLVGHSRHLRSGRLIARQTSTASQPWRLRESSSTSSPSSKQTKNAVRSGRNRQTNAHGRVSYGNTNGLGLITSTLCETTDLSGGIDGGGDNDHTGSDLPAPSSIEMAPNSSSSPPQTPHQSPVEVEELNPSLRPQGREDQNGPPTRSEDVGLPSDELWDHTAAFKSRFCFEHGESEYLLGTPDRWMSAGDFDIPNAEAALEANFEKYKEHPFEFDPHSRQCQAECRGRLFNHVHSVIEKNEDGPEMLHLIRWCAVWTPASNIGDKDWIPASLEANKIPNGRWSTRLAESVGKRNENYEKMMMVIRLE